MSITENKNRIKRFTSSKISKLCTKGTGKNGFGAPALTYIEEVNLEIKLGRSISTETYSRDMAWGTFLEQRVNDFLEFDYNLVSQETKVHPSIKFWAGSADILMPGVKIGEIKCYQLKKFAQYTDAIMMQDIELIKKDFPEEYWQIVSNSIINEVARGEAISYMPYESELPILYELAEYYDGNDQWKYQFISESNKSSLAYLPDGGYYKNINRFEFEVPQTDKDFLTERVKLAGTMLQQIERKMEIA